MSTRKPATKRPARKAAKPSTSTGAEASAPEPSKPTPSPLPQSDPEKKPFVPENLDRTVIAIPLLKLLREEEEMRKENPTAPPKLHAVIIDLNLEFHEGREEARKWVKAVTPRLIEQTGRETKKHGINEALSDYSQQYLFAKLEGDVIRELVRRDAEEHKTLKASASANSPRAIYHIWPDFKVRRLTNRSISTVKADAAHASFAALGQRIVWAVMDSGIDEKHPHFELYKNLELDPPLEHMDFTGEKTPLLDAAGHGTHVAGIIAGGVKPASENGSAKTVKGKKTKSKPEGIRAYVRNRDENGEITYNSLSLSNGISGMAPKCKLMSLRVLDENGEGEVSALIAAIAKIQEINGYGRRLLIHGVNISIGNDFEPEWFACGQSPLCVEVNRLVSSGVVVVVAAGNSGYNSLQTADTEVIAAGMSLTINDPGNADQAITVGATHKDMPHVYGVSYFSSKGPTGDGRFKPDLVAPGEKIVSCAAGRARTQMTQKVGDCDYIEDSGTSMAAPHVSGAIAAFLSIRREFIGQPDKVKEIFLSTATDLKRERYFQGHGLVDLMRAIQSV